VAGQALTTDGTGNLSWALPSTSAGGADTELQFNNSGVVTGIPTATYDGGILYLGDTTTVSIAGGSAGQSLTTDGAGTLAWSPALIGSWISAGPITIGAVTTAPIKGSVVNDFIRYRKVADREYQIQAMYSQSTGGTSGNGDYLFSLPAGLEFDFSALGQVQSTAPFTVPDGTVAPTTLSLSIPGGIAGVISFGQYSVTVLIVPYSPTQFRILTAQSWDDVNENSQRYVSNGWFAIGNLSLQFNLNFSIIATV
jgi:hypothetical protein